jgi:uncharacterized protein (DUF885 family)
MKTPRLLLIILALVVLVLSCATDRRPFEGSSSRFDRFLERLAREYIELKPHLVASAGTLENLGFNTPPPDLPSFADSELLREFRWVEKSRKTLRSFAAELLTPEQRIYRQVIDFWFSDVLAGEQFFYHHYLIDHFFGIQVVLPEFSDILPVASEEQAQRYLTLLAEVPGAVDDSLEACRLREDKGLVPPTIIIKQVMDQIRSFIYAPSEQNLMYASFSQALGRISGLSAVRKNELRAEAKRLITERVHTAFKDAMAYLSDLRQTGKSIEVGLLELPKGEAYYRYLLKHYTTLEMTPAEIHQLGLTEMERIEGEITVLLAATGKEVGIPAALANIGGEVFSGRETIFAEYGNIIASMEKALPSLFITLPEKKIALEKAPLFKEKVAGNFYYVASLDDSRPGRSMPKPWPPTTASTTGPNTGSAT